MDDSGFDGRNWEPATAGDFARLAWLISEVKIAAGGLRLVGESLRRGQDDLHGDAVSLTGTSLDALHARLEETRQRLQRGAGAG